MAIQPDESAQMVEPTPENISKMSNKTRYVPRNMGMPPACKGLHAIHVPCIYNQQKQCIYKYIPNKNQIVYVCHRIKLQQGLNSGKLV